MTDFSSTNNEFDLSEDLLSAYIDGELGPADRNLVESHLAESAQWRVVLDEITNVRSALRSLPERDAPSEFWERLAAVTDTEAAVIDIDKYRRRNRRRNRWMTAIGGAAVAAVLVIGIVVIPKTDKAQPPIGVFSNRHAVQAVNGGAPIVDLVSVATRNRFSR